MNQAISLDYRVNRLGFWCAIVVIVTLVVSFFLPLDAPGVYTAEHADRVAWLSANRNTFILG
jgi:heme/copper-type cytochrome/quinol oxidase subunit 1